MNDFFTSWRWLKSHAEVVARAMLRKYVMIHSCTVTLRKIPVAAVTDNEKGEKEKVNKTHNEKRDTEKRGTKDI